MEPEVQAEILREHHERTTEAEHEAEAAQEVAARAESESRDLLSLLDTKAEREHEHPAYATHEELASLRSDMEGLYQATERAADATEAAAERITEPAEGGAEDGTSELPLPEPEVPAERWERRHGRYQKVSNA